MDRPTIYPQLQVDTSTPAEEDDELIIIEDEELDTIRALSIFVGPHETVRASAPMLNWIYLRAAAGASLSPFALTGTPRGFPNAQRCLSQDCPRRAVGKAVCVSAQHDGAVSLGLSARSRR